jgi:katanin p80 WD40 repeat-containing subunit B1
LAIPNQTFISADSIFDEILHRNTTMQSILTERLNNIREVRNVWREDAIKASIEKLSKIRDSSTLVDILRILVLKPSMLSLDVTVEILPLITELLFEMYEE